MGFADFFDKNVSAAAGVLQSFERETFKALLESVTVALTFDHEGASGEGKATAELLVDILVRLYPKIALVPLEKGLESFVAALRKRALLINKNVEIKDDFSGTTVCVVIGTTRVSPELRPIYIGSDNWVCRISDAAPVGSGSSSNPFGAGAAACFAAANVFRAVFCLQLQNGSLDKKLTLSLYNLAQENNASSNPMLGDVDLGELHVAGLGAIGNGFIWALARLPVLKGAIHLIDPETLDLSNLQRYVLSRRKDIGKPKVTLMAKQLKRATLDVHPYSKSWSEFYEGLLDRRLERVVTALDTAQDRIGVQTSLPRRILNSWTRQENFGVSAHAFLGDGACLACLYMPTGTRKNEDEIVAEALRLTDQLMRVRTLMYSNQPIDQPLLQMVSERWQVPLAELQPFADLPIRQFYQDAVCGGALLKIGSDLAGQAVPVPMAHQSCLAGIVLAASLVVELATGVKPEGRVATINLLRPLGAYLQQPHRKHAGGRCFCQDADFIEAYRDKYRAAEG
jgi:molybdopterin/thiamine biosynthesis adenylyltransferase